MEIACPKCGSHDLHADKKGFSGKKAVAGAVLAGPIGLLAGTIRSNKVKITCLACGNVFSPGQTKHSPLRGNHAPQKEVSPSQKKATRIFAIIVAIFTGLFALALLDAGFSGTPSLLWVALFFGFITFLLIRVARKMKAPSDINR
jgi:hypothetical protein